METKLSGGNTGYLLQVEVKQSGRSVGSDAAVVPLTIMMKTERSQLKSKGLGSDRKQTNIDIIVLLRVDRLTFSISRGPELFRQKAIECPIRTPAGHLLNVGYTIRNTIRPVQRVVL